MTNLVRQTAPCHPPDERPRISLVVAQCENGVIGKEGRLPWRLPGDLQRFKQLTMGHHLVMGRKTLDSIGRILPGRTSLVLTRQADYQPPPGCESAIVIHDLTAAIAIARAAADSELFVIGGGEIYRLALPIADAIHRTLVHAALPGDAVFPWVDPTIWRLVSEEAFPADSKNQFAVTVQLWERQSSLSENP